MSKCHYAMKIASLPVALSRQCERCQRQAVHRHHEDYSKPLEVVYLCRSCHFQRHKELGWGFGSRTGWANMVKKMGGPDFLAKIGKVGGSKSKRTLTPEQARKMVIAREQKRKQKATK